MTIDEERKQLINKLQFMGVSCVRVKSGKTPYTMPIEELRTLCKWFENHKSKEKVKV